MRKRGQQISIFLCRGEHILLFLVQTVARQSVEHCQYRPPRIREDRNRKAANAEGRIWSLRTCPAYFQFKSFEGKGFSFYNKSVSLGVGAGLLIYKNNLISCVSDSDMPDHDLEPPRFAQLALERVLQDWNALKSMIMFGSEENKDP